MAYRTSPPNPTRAMARCSDIAIDCVGSCLRKGRYILAGSMPRCLRASFLPFMMRLPRHSTPGENARDSFPRTIHCTGWAFSGGPWASAPTPPPSVKCTYRSSGIFGFHLASVLDDTCCLIKSREFVASVVRVFCSHGFFPFKTSYRGVMISGGIRTILRSHCKDPTNCCISWSVLM